MRFSMDSSRARSLSFGAVPRLLGTLLVLAGLAALPGCSSGGAQSDSAAHKTGKPIELRYRAIAKNLSFGIVNESHTDRTELYSSRQPIDQATTKVSPDEVVDAIVEYFRDQGFFAIAQSGGAPKTPPPGTSQMLEVDLPEGPYHAVLRPGVTADYAKTFQTCAKALLDVYNSTMQLQAVDSAPAWGGNAPQPTGGKKSSKGGGSSARSGG
ncbi:MAG: hypothetical protein NTY35_15545 [Planctomycetota bacterium]|nr:hypothetical protein [Planctomycetota bacterium]